VKLLCLANDQTFATTSVVLTDAAVFGGRAKTKNSVDAVAVARIRKRVNRWSSKVSTRGVLIHIKQGGEWEF
jgi:hypothetical protein